VVKAMVNAGGDLRAFAPADALPLRIGIRDPEGDPDQILGVFEIRDAAVATSGNYENYVEIDGRRFGHILDPRTGRPAEDTLSATVRAPTAMLADGLATAVFVLGPAQGMGLVEEIDGVEAILLYRDRGGVQHLQSSGMGRIDWLDPVAPP
jgi:thiamine biosynthesis lipoprotein